MSQSWNCLTLNEHVYRASNNFMETGRVNLESKIRSNPKSSVEDKQESKNNPEEIEEHFTSEYRDKFHASCKTLSADKREMFDQIFKSQGYGEELLMDYKGITYSGNYVTTSDLMFNHLKKGICGPLTRSYSRGKYLPQTDLMAVYQSLTNWGLYKGKEKILQRPPSQFPNIEVNMIVHGI